MPREKRAQKFKISRFVNRGGARSWRVAGTLPDGTRVRRNYSEKAEAIAALADLESEAAGAPEERKPLRTSLSLEQVADAEAAVLQLGSMRLSAAVSHYLSLRARTAEKGVGLDAAISFFEGNYHPASSSISILNARDEFLHSRSNITPRTLRNYERSLSLLLRPDPNKPVHCFTVSDIERALSRHQSSGTKITHRRIFSVFFNWAVRHHYCLEDPCKRLDKLPKDLSEIAILSLEEVKRLLWAAMRYQEGAAAAAVAIALFAGLRPSELAELKAEDVGKERIRVTGGKLRRKLKRTVPIAPVLASWLERFPFRGMPDGWDYKLKQLKNATKAEKWVQDILRHTSISFQTERDKNEALTAYNCGTSIKMMDLHYRNTIEDPKVVQSFWALTPDHVAAAKPKVSLPTRKRVEWPDKPALKKLVWSKPLIHAAKDLQVSDVALKKHCVKLNITLPPVGHWARQKAAD